MKGISRISIKLICALVLSIGLRASAADEVVSTAILPTQNYCGLYCVYGAAIHEGISFDFTSLLNSKYIKCSKGSSLDELQQAAEDHGLHTLPITGMDPSMLVRSEKPVALFVRSDLSAPNFDHYILYLRHVDQKFLCLDIDHVVAFTEPELLSRWSRVGMVLSSSEIKPLSILTPAWASSACWLIVPLGIAFGLRYFGPPLVNHSKGMARLFHIRSFQVAAIAATAVVVALIYNQAAASGLLVNGNQIQQIQAAHAGNFIPKLSEPAAYSEYTRKSAQFVDARFVDDFSAGHIAGAISLPVNLDDSSRKIVMKDIPRSAHLIIYCESRGCPFATAVASRLTGDGYSDVSIYTDGWEGWRDKNSN